MTTTGSATVEGAFAMLRPYSRTNRSSLRDVALAIVEDGLELPGG